MGIALTLKELRATPDDQLIQLHDADAEHTMTGVTYYLGELARRDAERQTRTIVRLTWAIAAMTGVVVLLTVVNVTIVAFVALRG